MYQRGTFLGGGGSGVRDIALTSLCNLVATFPEMPFIPSFYDLFYANQLLCLDNNLKRLIPIILLCLLCSLSKMHGP